MSQSCSTLVADPNAQGWLHCFAFELTIREFPLFLRELDRLWDGETRVTLRVIGSVALMLRAPFVRVTKVYDVLEVASLSADGLRALTKDPTPPAVPDGVGVGATGWCYWMVPTKVEQTGWRAGTVMSINTGAERAPVTGSTAQTAIWLVP